MQKQFPSTIAWGFLRKLFFSRTFPWQNFSLFQSPLFECVVPGRDVRLLLLQRRRYCFNTTARGIEQKTNLYSILIEFCTLIYSQFFHKVDDPCRCHALGDSLVSDFFSVSLCASFLEWRVRWGWFDCNFLFCACF